MTNSLLFIPDISGFTQFVQNTEVDHSQHVISELLEVLITANNEDPKGSPRFLVFLFQQLNIHGN